MQLQYWCGIAEKHAPERPARNLFIKKRAVKNVCANLHAQGAKYLKPMRKEKQNSTWLHPPGELERPPCRD
jgi:hypothetical protein